MKEWILVANRAEAKIFVRESKNNRLDWKETLENKAGRRHESEFHTGKPGFNSSHFKGDFSIHALDSHFDHATIVAEKFAKKIIKILKRAHAEKKFQSLTVCAEPKFLGKLKTHSKNELSKLNIQWIAKDIEKGSTEEIFEHLNDRR